MEVQPLEIYASDSNYAIIKPPGRQLPGCVVQGDTLSNLCSSIQAIARKVRMRCPRDPELNADIAELNDLLIGRLLHYQKVLAAHGISLPYEKSFTENDLLTVDSADHDDDLGEDTSEL